MAPLLGELSPQATERFRHNYTVSLIKKQSHRGHLGKLLFKRMAELGGVQAADQLDPGALHHKTFMGQGEQSPHIQQRGIPHREPERFFFIISHKVTRKILFQFTKTRFRCVILQAVS